MTMRTPLILTQTPEERAESLARLRADMDAAGPRCETDGTREDGYGAEHHWQCGGTGSIEVDGRLLCEDCAGRLGYGPKQEAYGFDPEDGLNPDRDITREGPE